MGQKPLVPVLKVDSCDVACPPEPVVDCVSVDTQYFSTPGYVAEKVKVGQQSGRKFGELPAQLRDAFMPQACLRFKQLK